MSITWIILLCVIAAYLIFEIYCFISKYNSKVSFATNMYLTLTRRGMKFLFYGNSHCPPEGFLKRRRITDALQSLTFPNISWISGVTKQHICITTTTGFFEPLYIYRPKGSEQEVLPFIFMCHGGGFCLGNIATYEKQIITIVKQCHICIVYCDYRMAPQYKYPTAINDCYDALIALLDNNKKYFIDSNKCILLGDSAGGNICETLCQKIASTKYKLIYQILLYPASDFSCLSENIFTEDMPSCIPHFAGTNMVEYYLRSMDEKRLPSVSPIYYEDFSIYPPTFVLTCEYDTLTSGTLGFIEKLNKAGITVVHNHMKETVHGIWQQFNLTNYINKEIIYYVNSVLYQHPV